MYNGINVTVGQITPAPQFTPSIIFTNLLSILPIARMPRFHGQGGLPPRPVPLQRDGLTAEQLEATIKYLEGFIPAMEEFIEILEELKRLAESANTPSTRQQYEMILNLQSRATSINGKLQALELQYGRSIPEAIIAEIAYAIVDAAGSPLQQLPGLGDDAILQVGPMLIQAMVDKAKEILRRLKGPNYLLYGGIGVGIIAAGTTAYFMLRKPKPTPKKRRRKKSKRNK